MRPIPTLFIALDQHTCVTLRFFFCSSLFLPHVVRAVFSLSILFPFSFDCVPTTDHSWFERKKRKERKKRRTKRRERNYNEQGTNRIRPNRIRVAELIIDPSIRRVMDQLTSIDTMTILAKFVSNYRAYLMEVDAITESFTIGWKWNLNGIMMNLIQYIEGIVGVTYRGMELLAGGAGVSLVDAFMELQGEVTRGNLLNRIHKNITTLQESLQALVGEVGTVQLSDSDIDHHAVAVTSPAPESPVYQHVLERLSKIKQLVETGLEQVKDYYKLG